MIHGKLRTAVNSTVSTFYVSHVLVTATISAAGYKIELIQHPNFSIHYELLSSYGLYNLS
jgi:hypothetical protein